MDVKRSKKENSPWVKTKAKTGPKKMKSGEFGDEEKFSWTGTRARRLISLQKSAKRNMAINSVVLHPKV